MDDLIQETYARLFRSSKAGTLDKPQAYLFATARNCAFDRLPHVEVARSESLENSPI